MTMKYSEIGGNAYSSLVFRLNCSSQILLLLAEYGIRISELTINYQIHVKLSRTIAEAEGLRPGAFGSKDP